LSVRPSIRLSQAVPCEDIRIVLLSPPGIIIVILIIKQGSIVAKLLEPGDGMRGVCVRAIRIARPHRLSSANRQFINDVQHAHW